MRVSYWYARCDEDADCYSIRERTRKAARATMADRGFPEDFGPLVKVTVEYSSGFELLKYALSEGGIAEEARAALAAERREVGWCDFFDTED